MTELQKRLLDMLKAFHTICEKEGLKYYLLGGSLLGAVRHGGFIPWDDDLDVGMPRADYEKLKKLCVSLETEKYCFEYPGKKDFVYPFAKMYDKSTTLIENTRYKTKRGIYIDIFPLDGLGDTKEDAVANFNEIDRLVNLFETKVCAIRRGRKLYKNLAIIVMRCIPGFILGRNKTFNAIEKKSLMHPYESSVYVANCVGNWHEKEITKREYIGEPVLSKFEDTELYIVADSDAYLTGVYGDWRKLPPEEKRVSHHDYIKLDLDKPYSAC